MFGRHHRILLRANSLSNSLRHALFTTNVNHELHNASLEKASLQQEESKHADLLRAVYFLRNQEPLHARQALLEGLRVVPHAADSELTRQLLFRVQAVTAPWTQLPPEIAELDPLFAMLYHGLQPFTMLTPVRLLSLYLHVKAICDNDVPGDIVECGTAGGGSVVLMAVAAKHFSKRPRRVFACDTFSGMPAPNDRRDQTNHSTASSSNWSTGTCSSGGEQSVQSLAHCFGVDLKTVPGLFCDTLPSLPVTSIAMLHADGDWYESTKEILVQLEPRVVSGGGTIQIDDFGYWNGCRAAVEEHIPPAKLRPVDGIAVTYRK